MYLFTRDFLADRLPSRFSLARELFRVGCACSNNGLFAGKGGKNRRRGKNENETEKRELVFKEDGQGERERERVQCRMCSRGGKRTISS